MGFTRLELPSLESYETAVSFPPELDRLSVHHELSQSFGQAAGLGRYLYCADSSVAGRFWIRSSKPWLFPPSSALSALDPKREVLQLATGLTQHFSMDLCVGDVSVSDGRKFVLPYPFPAQWEAWLRRNGEAFGLRPLVVTVRKEALRFRHAGVAFRVDYAVIEGALEVVAPERLLHRLLRGFGSHRRLGLGMLKLRA